MGRVVGCGCWLPCLAVCLYVSLTTPRLADASTRDGLRRLPPAAMLISNPSHLPPLMPAPGSPGSHTSTPSALLPKPCSRIGCRTTGNVSSRMDVRNPRAHAGPVGGGGESFKSCESFPTHLHESHHGADLRRLISAAATDMAGLQFNRVSTVPTHNTQSVQARGIERGILVFYRDPHPLAPRLVSRGRGRHPVSI